MTPRIPRGRVRRALVVAWLVALALPIAASAHAELLRANPEDGQVVTAPVTAVTGRYSEDLQRSSRLDVKDSSGRLVGRGGVDPQNDRRMIVTLASALREGDFTVESTALSVDGDLQRETWRFTVELPTSPSPTATPAESPLPTAGESPTAIPSPSAPTETSPSPSASPTPADTTSDTGDVLLPILAGLTLLAVGAAFLLNRSRTPRA